MNKSKVNQRVTILCLIAIFSTILIASPITFVDAETNQASTPPTDFTSEQTAETALNNSIFLVCAAIVLVIVLVGVFMKRRNRTITKNWIEH